jgi:hypothetical protein
MSCGERTEVVWGGHSWPPPLILDLVLDFVLLRIKIKRRTKGSALH